MIKEIIYALFQKYYYMVNLDEKELDIYYTVGDVSDFHKFYLYYIEVCLKELGYLLIHNPKFIIPEIFITK